jgi:hypothetical protein
LNVLLRQGVDSDEFSTLSDVKLGCAGENVAVSEFRHAAPQDFPQSEHLQAALRLGTRNLCRIDRAAVDARYVQGDLTVVKANDPGAPKDADFAFGVGCLQRAPEALLPRRPRDSPRDVTQSEVIGHRLEVPIEIPVRARVMRDLRITRTVDDHACGDAGSSVAKRHLYPRHGVSHHRHTAD